MQLTKPRQMRFAESRMIGYCRRTQGILQRAHIKRNHLSVSSKDGQLVTSCELAQIVQQGFPVDQINYAFGYGSGVFTQQLTQTDSSIHDSVSSTSKQHSKPMLDFIFTTNNVREFHLENMARNSKHYSLVSRALGSHFICHFQDVGPGLYFHPYAKVQLNPSGSQQYNLKYGVMSVAKLKQDLKDWTWLYVAGRMQKPTVSIDLSTSSSPTYSDEILEYQQKYNLKYALAAALLLVPPTPRMESLPTTCNLSNVYELLVGLSYSGDPRIKAGAEDPQKIQKLVHSSGNLSRLNDLYSEQWSELEQYSLVHRLEGGEKIEIDLFNPTWRRELWQRLPPIIKSTSTASTLDAISQKQVIHGRDVFTSSELLKHSLSKIVGPAARIQSLKGFVTAGVVNSLRYASAKFSKGLSFSR